VHIYAVGTAIDLRGAQLDQVQKGGLKPAILAVVVQRVHETHSFRKYFGIVYFGFHEFAPFWNKSEYIGVAALLQAPVPVKIMVPLCLAYI
jgi:hypothetical protein